MPAAFADRKKTLALPGANSGSRLGSELFSPLGENLTANARNMRAQENRRVGADRIITEAIFVQRDCWPRLHFLK
jgi:hypothetical protein